MNINQRFAVFCAKQCLHLWNPSEKVLAWFDDPIISKESLVAADLAWDSAAKLAWESEGSATAYAATYAAAWAFEAIDTENIDDTEDAADDAIERSATALGITIGELKHRFVSTWTDEELKTNKPEWIEYATVELFSR